MDFFYWYSVRCLSSLNLMPVPVMTMTHSCTSCSLDCLQYLIQTLIVAKHKVAKNIIRKNLVFVFVSLDCLQYLIQTLIVAKHKVAKNIIRKYLVFVFVSLDCLQYLIQTLIVAKHKVAKNIIRKYLVFVFVHVCIYIWLRSNYCPLNKKYRTIGIVNHSATFLYAATCKSKF
jgi:hypothetical protein